MFYPIPPQTQPLTQSSSRWWPGDSFTDKGLLNRHYLSHSQLTDCQVTRSVAAHSLARALTDKPHLLSQPSQVVNAPMCGMCACVRQRTSGECVVALFREEIISLVQILAWRRPGGTPLSEPMMERCCPNAIRYYWAMTHQCDAIFYWQRLAKQVSGLWHWQVISFEWNRGMWLLVHTLTSTLLKIGKDK